MDSIELFILLQGASSHFDNSGYARGQPIVDYYRDGEPTQLPENFYSSDFYTDEMIRYIDEGISSGNPFFGYLSLALHTSHLCPKRIDRKIYRALYARVDVIREQRHASMKVLDVINEGLRWQMPRARAALERTYF